MARVAVQPVENLVAYKMSSQILDCYLRQELVGSTLAPGDTIQVTILGELEKFSVLSVDPEDKVISKEVEIVIDTPALHMNIESSEQVIQTLSGVDEQIQIISDLARLTFYGSEHFESVRIPLPKAAIIYGSSGTGKSMLGRQIGDILKVNVVYIQWHGLFAKYVGESESKIQEQFTQARESAPAVLYLDDIDAISPSKDSQEFQHRILSTLLSELDAENTGLLILATTSKLRDLDLALRRRFDKEVEFPVPGQQAREEILKSILPETDQGVIRGIAEQAHGYVGSDLQCVVKEAILSAFKSEREITYDDLITGLNQVSPASLKDIVTEIPKVYWTDIGGYEDVKTQLRHAVEWPLIHTEAFTRLNINPPKGILMYGPPGCSKTMMAKAIATESSMNFIAIKGPELFSKYVGDTERSIRELFRKARQSAPTVIFIDEIDAMGAKREGSEVGINERVLCTLLNEIDGVETVGQIIFLAATNRPELIDSALLRPGRIDRLIYIPLPDQAATLKILEITSKMPLDSDVDFTNLAKTCSGMSGAEISLIAREAGLVALSESIDIENVAMRHFETARWKIKPRVKDTSSYDLFNSTH